MPATRISLALEEGFLNDRVSISANGELLAEEADVSTRVQIGLARTIELELPGDATEIVISVPEKGLRRAVPLRPDPPAYVGVSIAADGGLSVRTGAAAPGYL